MTNHIRFGEHKAILAGDYGFILPLKIVMELNNLKIENKMVLTKYFIEDTLKMFEGEMKDLIFEKEDIEVEIEDILDMYAKNWCNIWLVIFRTFFHGRRKSVR